MVRALYTPIMVANRGTATRLMTTPGVLPALILVAWILLAVSGCSAPVTRLDKEHTSATVPVGGKVVIDLGMTNSSVGYRWVRVDGPGPHLTESPEEAPAGPRPVGGASEQTDTYSATSAGTATLTYEYQVRPEITGQYGPSGRRVTFTVTVQ